MAFATTHSGNRRIEIVGTADRNPSTVCDDCDAPTTWSMDGKRLLYREAGPFRLVLYDFSENRQTELLRHPTWNLERPRFSPDGRWVTFHTSKSPNTKQIYSAPIGGAGAVPERSWVPAAMDHGCHPA